MSHRLEVTLKSHLMDAEGEIIRRKARDYFGLVIDSVRTIGIITLDANLDAHQLETIRKEAFTNPVTQKSSYDPLPVAFDWCIWVGFRPGVRDNPGATAREAIEDVLGMVLAPGAAIFTSKRFCLTGKKLTREDVDRLAGQLLANDIIQQWRIYEKSTWDPAVGIGFILPRVVIDHAPTVSIVAIDSEKSLAAVSDARNLALNVTDIPTIRNYFLEKRTRAQREALGLGDPTDLELEYISQGRSDHCNHNTFRGLFHYREAPEAPVERVDNLFKTCIEAPTLALQEKKPWVVSVLWDNAGVARFDDHHYYVVTGETHNSPSNMEAYGGSITGIVGVYRDPLGTGKGSRLIMGSYGFCVGDRLYDGPLQPRLHPRRLLDGIIEGVRDGGNKSGIPTSFGQVLFDPGYMGKCLVFVTALGLMPATVHGEPAEKKHTSPGECIVMSGGRVGKDGIHGVTASSEVFSDTTPAGHVQIGDPYTQKKMHDFLLEARDRNLIRFITDNGGGGLSSSIGESARFSNGCVVELDKVPLKYQGLDQWEIWISESQERMTVSVAPQDIEAFMALSCRHAVESTVIGRYTDSGKLHITWEGKTCAYVDLDLLSSGFPQWEFEAVWQSPESRGMHEPVLGCPQQFTVLLKDMLARPNMASKAWICRQYDHEVQGTSVVKPLVGRSRDVHADAAVIRPVLSSNRCLAFSQALNPHYSVIDAYHMVACTIDESVRRLLAVGADFEQIGGVDNFCWPNIQYHPIQNPDGRFKAAQLVRACRALRETCLAYEIPLLSGKDSMYVDGHLPGRYGETHKVSALETMQFSATSVIGDVSRAVTLDAKFAGDLVYVLGKTRDELGGSEYYQHLGYVGANVPRVRHGQSAMLYRALATAISSQWVASAHGIYRGGLGVHLAMVAMAGDLGLRLDLDRVPATAGLSPDRVLFSESAGRFIVTVSPEYKEAFETCFARMACACIGVVTDTASLEIGAGNTQLIQAPVAELKAAWQSTFDF